MSQIQKEEVVAETVVCERLVIRDPSGKTRIELGLDAHGGAQVNLFDKTGVARLTLLVDAAEGAPLVCLRDMEGVARANLVADRKFTALCLNDYYGRPRASINLTSEGDGGVTLADRNGLLRAGLHINLDNPELVGINPDGQVVFIAPISSAPAAVSVEPAKPEQVNQHG